MKKTMLYVLVVLTAVLLFSGCIHIHQWEEATCEEPKHCTICGKSEGEALGHSWMDATCTEPNTCSVCGATDGEAFGHVWEDATCTKPQTCSVCGETEGKPLGHSWIDATCTEAKTCEVCGETEGDALGHDTPDLTCTGDAECLRCGETITAPGHTWVDATCTEPQTCSVCGETEGEALGHTTSAGVCERCGEEVYEKVYGYGDEVLTDINTGDGIYRVHFINDASRNFIVKAYDDTGDKELLVNEIGPYNGYVLLTGTSPYMFEVQSNGDWSYKIESLGTTTDTSFSGKGDYVTEIFPGSTGVWRLTHDGDSNFAVWLYTSDGRDLLVNEIGSYDGEKIVTIPKNSNAFLEITADGYWTITPEE